MKKQYSARSTVALVFASALLAVAMVAISMTCLPDDYCKSHGLLFYLVIVSGILDIYAMVHERIAMRPSSLDILVLLLLILMTASHLMHRIPAGELRYMSIFISAFVYFGIRFRIMDHTLFTDTFMAGMTLVVLWQVIYGILQIMQVLQSNSDLFPFTGSFTNPGPLGGFLAMSAAGMAAWSCQRKGFYASFIRFGAFVAIAGAVFSSSRAALLSLGISALVWLFYSAEIRRKINEIRLLKPFRSALYITLAAILTVGFGAASYCSKKKSADSRLLMDKISMIAIAKGSLTGSGPGGFPASYAKAQSDYFSRGNYTENERLLADCPQKAFNEFLEIGVEAGPAAMLFSVAIVVIALFILIPRRSPFGYMLLSFAVFSLFSYPLLFLQFRIPIVLCVASAAEHQPRLNINRKVPVIIWNLLFMIFPAGLILMKSSLEGHIKASEEWHSYSSWYDSRMYKAICDNCAELYDNMKHNPVFLAQYGFSLALIGELDRSDSVLTDMSLISSNPISYNRMAENCLERGDYTNAEMLFRKSFSMVPNRLQPLAGIARTLYSQGKMESFKQVADSVFSFVPKVESSTTMGIRKEIADLYSENRQQECLTKNTFN